MEQATTALPALQDRTKEVQEQLGQVGSSLGRIGKNLFENTTELFDQVAEAIQLELSQSGALSTTKRRGTGTAARQRGSTAAAKYSRLYSEVSAMQRDSSTYCDEPEDQDDYSSWLEGFSLVEKKPTIDSIVLENTFMAELQNRIVPLIVEYDVFWRRYFYRLHKLEQKHQQRLQLAQRANQVTEEVGWDDDDPESLRRPNPAGTDLSNRGGASAAVLTSASRVDAQCASTPALCHPLLH